MDILTLFAAEYLVWIVVLAGVVYMALSPRRKNIALLAAVALPLAYALGKVAGWAWYNPRPFVSEGVAPLFAHAANNGFPSDHTLLGAVIASIIFAYDKRLGALLFALALSLGAARVYAGVHHFVDVIAAALIAAAAAWLARALLHTRST